MPYYRFCIVIASSDLVRSNQSDPIPQFLSFSSHTILKPPTQTQSPSLLVEVLPVKWS